MNSFMPWDLTMYKVDQIETNTLQFTMITLKGKEGNLNFELLSDSWLTFGVAYDPKSFMHYHWNAFAKDYSKPTISSKVL